MIRPLIALALLASPALADETTYRCNGGSTLTLSMSHREAVVRRPGDFDIAMPLAGWGMQFAWWSPHGSSVECDKAPCAEDFAYTGGPEQVWYILDEGQRVDCFAN
jgi:hypothetical protein